MGFLTFLKKYKQQIIFKLIALLLLVFFSVIYNNNFSVCESVKSIKCGEDVSFPESAKEIAEEYRCISLEDKSCCRYIYPDNAQCYLIVLKQSIFVGITGSLLMIFAELFYFISWIIYFIFPFLTNYIVYEGYIINRHQEAARLSAEVFAKAIYLISPIMLLIILFSLYRSLPYFI